MLFQFMPCLRKACILASRSSTIYWQIDLPVSFFEEEGSESDGSLAIGASASMRKDMIACKLSIWWKPYGSEKSIYATVNGP